MLHRDHRTDAGPRVLACALLAALLLCLSLAAGARATSVEGGNAFNELSQKAQEETPTTETTETATTGTEKAVTTSHKTVFIGIGAALVLLIAIASVIVRDARRVAPADDGDPYDLRKGNDPSVRRRNRRAKAKAAKAQRKRHKR